LPQSSNAAVFSNAPRAAGPTLHRLADAITSRLQAFAGRHGRAIAARLGRPAALTTSLLRAEIEAHLR
jgi:hypothetical protein